jgi:hypothetical protein
VSPLPPYRVLLGMLLLWYTKRNVVELTFVLVCSSPESIALKSNYLMQSAIS